MTQKVQNPELPGLGHWCVRVCMLACSRVVCACLLGGRGQPVAFLSRSSTSPSGEPLSIPQSTWAWQTKLRVSYLPEGHSPSTEPGP